MKFGGNVAFCLPSGGRRTQLFHLIFTQPGAHLLVHHSTVRMYDHDHTVGGTEHLQIGPFTNEFLPGG